MSEQFIASWPVEHYKSITGHKVIQTISGAAANKLFSDYGIYPVKLCNEECIHNGLEFIANTTIVDPIKFQTHVPCHQGGIYFASSDRFYHWIQYGDKTMAWIFDITFPDDAEVYMELGEFSTNTKWKASAMILGDKIALQDHPAWLDTVFSDKAIKYEYTLSVFHKDRTIKDQVDYAKRSFYSDYPRLLSTMDESVQINAILLSMDYNPTRNKLLSNPLIIQTEGIQLAVAESGIMPAILSLRNPSNRVRTAILHAIMIRNNWTVNVEKLFFYKILPDDMDVYVNEYPEDKRAVVYLKNDETIME